MARGRVLRGYGGSDRFLGQDHHGHDPRTHNLPGDGKFDQSTTAGPVRLEVGRIDMANLSGFPLGEDELMRQYLNKDHDFRHRRLIARSRALVNDNLGVLGGEVPALNGWENFAPLVGSANVTEGRWLTDLVLDDYLWAYGCGAGSYNSAAGVVDTLHFLVYDPKAIFTMLFGSYFGDWDSENNLLRAPLAMSSYTLTSVWGGRPNWFVHPMGLGETIGFSARLTQNNTGVYRGYSPISSGPIIAPSDADSLLKGVHVALMGDPTLRMQPVAPPLDLGAVANAAGGVELTWNESLDPVLGYHVYRAAAAGGPFSRITSALVNGRAYIDEALTAESYRHGKGDQVGDFEQRHLHECQPGRLRPGPSARAGHRRDHLGQPRGEELANR